MTAGLTKLFADGGWSATGCLLVMARAETFMSAKGLREDWEARYPPLRFLLG